MWLVGLGLGNRPMSDLKHILVVMNGGYFKGYPHLIGKSGKTAKIWDNGMEVRIII